MMETLWLCSQNQERLGELNAFDVNLTTKWASYDELTFSLSRTRIDNMSGYSIVDQMFDKIEPPRCVEVEGRGMFVIVTVDKTYADGDTVDVTAYSLEYALGSKYIDALKVNKGEVDSLEVMYNGPYDKDSMYAKNTEPYDAYRKYYYRNYTSSHAYEYERVAIRDQEDFDRYDGSSASLTLYVQSYPNIQLYDPLHPELSLLDIVLAYAPSWTIAEVDMSIALEERSFDESHVSVYDMLAQKIVEAYQCAVIFDSLHKTISVRSEPEIIEAPYTDPRYDTNIFVSRHSVASSLQTKYNADDIITRMSVSGGDDLTIREVNLGSNYIINLDYYENDGWMDEKTQRDWKRYKADYAAANEEYKKLSTQRTSAYNAWNDTMNGVPGDAGVVLVGDKFSKLYCVYEPIDTAMMNTLIYNEHFASVVPQAMRVYQQDEYQAAVSALGTVADKLLAVGADDIVDAGYPALDTSTGAYPLYALIKPNANGTKHGIFSPVMITDGAMRIVGPDEFDDMVAQFWANPPSPTPDWVLGSNFATAAAAQDKLNSYMANGRVYMFSVRPPVGFKINVGDVVCIQGYQYEQQLSMNQPVWAYRGATALIDESEFRRVLDMYHCYDNTADNQLLTLVKDDSRAIFSILCDKSVDPYVYKVRLTMSVPGTGGELVNSDHDFDAHDWINGDLRADSPLLSSFGLADYTVKGIGIMGAYFVTAKDERYEYNLVDYGVRLLEEKHKVYNTVLQIQTDAIFSTKDVQCHVGPTPQDNPAEGDRWYNDTTGALSSYSGTTWVVMKTDVPKEEAALYENFQRYTDNLARKNAVDAMLEKKKREADLWGYGDDEVRRPRSAAEADTTQLKIGLFLIMSSVYHTDSDFAWDSATQSYVFTSADDPIDYKVSSEYDPGEFYYLFIPYENRYVQMPPMTLEQFMLGTYYVRTGHIYRAFVDVDDNLVVTYKDSIAWTLRRMRDVAAPLEFETYFSESTKEKLRPLIRDGQYTDDGSVLNGLESEEERRESYITLIKNATRELASLAQPKLEFSASLANLRAIPEFNNVDFGNQSTQMRVGNYIRVELNDGEVRQTRLLEIHENLEDESGVSYTFGALLNPTTTHAQLLTGAINAGKTITAKGSSWSNGTKAGQAAYDQLNEGLAGATLALGENAYYDPYGMHFVDGNNGVLINGGTLAGTDDNWSTSHVVFRKYKEGWGVVADSVTGSVHINGPKGKIDINADGTMSLNGTQIALESLMPRLTVEIESNKLAFQRLEGGVFVPDYDDPSAPLNLQAHCYYGAQEITPESVAWTVVDLTGTHTMPTHHNAAGARKYVVMCTYRGQLASATWECLCI